MINKFLQHLRFILWAIITIIALNTVAQNDTNEIYTNFERNYDELLHSYYMQSNEKLLNQRFSSTTYNNHKASEVSDDVYQQRLKSIPSAIDLVYNSTVRNHITYYIDRIGDRVGVMLGMSKYYFPIFEDILDSYGIPSDLKYLVVIESAFNPNAVSKAGATGLWQFMYATGRTYDLRVNSIVDDRKDPIKSTHAAAKYLKDLYSIYNDWSLVLAAYNCGPGNVNKAIKRSGQNNFWQIYSYLPKETRNYVPAFIAATYVMNFYNEHDIRPIELTQPLNLITDTVIVNKDIYFGQIEKVMNIPIGELKDLNPQYKMDYIPGSQAKYSLKLPMKYINSFIELEDSISNTDKEKYRPNYMATNSDCDTCPYDIYASDIKYTTKTIYHKVRTKDTWTSVAKRYGVSVSDLKKWNKKIKSNKLKKGTLLTVKQRVKNTIKKDNTQTTNAVADTTNINNDSIQKPDNTTNQKNTNNIKKTQNTTTNTHTVKNGETLSKIAIKYNTTVNKLMKLNGLNQKTASKIKVGQKIKVK